MLTFIVALAPLWLEAALPDHADSGAWEDQVGQPISLEATKADYPADRDAWRLARLAHHSERVPF